MPRAKSGASKKASATIIRSLLSLFHRTKGALIPLGVVVAPILIFILWSAARDWILGALGYGLVPVGLWLASFTFALRYRYRSIKRFRRVWAGSALAVAVSLGLLSMFDASDGVMEDASLGGYWGGYLGGTPIAVGALKVAVIILLSPLLLSPRTAAPVYRLGLERVGRASAVMASRLWAWLKLEGPGVIRWASIPPRRVWRSIFKGPQTTPASGTISPLDALPESRPDGPPEDPNEVAEPVTPRYEASQTPAQREARADGWDLPSIELLDKAESQSIPKAALQDMSDNIENTLSEHKVDVAVEDVRIGARVIRFGLVPGWVKKYRESGGKYGAGDAPAIDMSRVKVQSILVREKDLALALKTPYLRLEAPVPGEALVGIEVPNPYPRTVTVRSVAESPPFQKIGNRGGLPVALGEDTGGEAMAADLADLPHLLIAGATGSGKSVCINSVVASLLLTCRPSKVRMLMVDPKRVELTPFNGIPHLMAPVIVETDQVLEYLRSVQNEMLRRYKLMEELGVRNIAGYNSKATDHLPFLILIIDELADLMMTAAYEVEQSLVRLAQLGRATGIHLILATQRPSVNVVTGLLKANIPTRIAFAVSSQVDSRVILDGAGAEKLLGKGDMLLLSSDAPKPKRVQGTFLHDREIERLVEFWKAQSGPPLPQILREEEADSQLDEKTDEGDDLLDRARALAEKSQHISPSVLQRRLEIGYPRAVRLMQLLEDEGVITNSV